MNANNPVVASLGLSLLGVIFMGMIGCNGGADSEPAPRALDSQPDTVSQSSNEESTPAYDADPEIDPSAASPPDSTGKPKSDLDLAVEAMLKERQRLDATVWAPEVLAQRYGKRIQRLSDDLRTGADKFAVLKNLSFEALVLARALKSETLDGGLTLHHFAPGGATVSPESWRAWLAELEAEKYQIIQSEWHQPVFSEPSEEEPAKSKVAATIHAVQPDESRRLILQATLDVAWKRQPDADGNFQPHTIQVEELTMTEWQGAAVFREIAVLGDSPRIWQVTPTLVYDLTHDGLPEVLLPGANKVLFNRGGRFEEETLVSDPAPRATAGIVADFTGDGLPDLITAGYRTFATLFRGDPTGRFTGRAESIQATGQPLSRPMNITAGDIDGDGDLDLWITQYLPPYYQGQMPTPYYDANDGLPSYMLRNLGDGKFEDATVAVGLAKKRRRRTYSSSLVDLDDDHDLDLVVVSDFSGLDVYKNDRGRFIDITAQAVDERANFGMAHVLDDFDRDGKLDLYVAGMYSNTAERLSRLRLGRAEFSDHQSMRPRMGYGNRLYLQQPDGTFRQPPWSGSVARTGWSWGTVSLDFDSDGDRDLYVANGHISGKKSEDYCSTFWRHDIYTGGPQPDPKWRAFFGKHLGINSSIGMSWNGYEHNHLKMNVDGRTFIEAGFLMGVAFQADSRSVVSTDINRDGRPDLLVAMLETVPGKPSAKRPQIHVLENHWPQPGNWIGVRLREAQGAPSPIGAKIKLTSAGTVQVAHVVTGDSFQAQHPLIKLFGLGKTSQLDSLAVTWPGGLSVKIEKPAINQYHDVALPVP